MTLPDRLDVQAPEMADWTVVSRYGSYADAQAAVDHLSDSGFPVAHLSIVSSDLRMVEKITGRRTLLGVAGAGAREGAVTGLWIGLLFGLLTTGHGWLAVLAYGLFIGAAGGALASLVSFWADRGKRDFTSVPFVAASHYDVVATDGQAERARIVLGQAGLLPAGW